MQTEFEATFTKIDKDDMRTRLNVAGAKLVRSEFLQRRIAFNLPKGHEIKGGWLRIRDEGDKITMSLKVVNQGKIEDQRETQLKVDSFENAEDFLRSVGCVRKAFQETKREIWQLNGADITIDEWPFLEPFVEIEGKSEQNVKSVSEKLGFDYNNAKFCAADTLYSEKYRISEDRVNNHTPEILFRGKNPFI